MKKRLLLALTAVAVLSLTACKTVEEQAQSMPESSSSAAEDYQAPPDPATPDGAVTILLESAKNWDMEAVEAFLPGEVSLEQYVPPALQNTFSQVLERMEYSVGTVTIEDKEAAVDLTITAVDAEGAVNDAIGTAVAYVAKQQLARKPIDDYTEVARVIADSIDIASLPTATTEATAYMTRDAAGEWKLDLSDPRNMPLANAVTGGSVEMAGRMKEMAETYGISLP